MLDEDEIDFDQLEGVIEALGDRADVPKVAARDEHPIGHLPVELLEDLDRDRLLSLDPQAVHRVREIDRRILQTRLLDRCCANRGDWVPVPLPL